MRVVLTNPDDPKMAHQAGFEPTTPAFGGRLYNLKNQYATFRIKHLVSG